MAADGKIQALNHAVREAIPHMQKVADENPNADVLVRAIKFSNGAQWEISQPTPVADFNGGASKWGFDVAAFDSIRQEVESRSKWRYTGGSDFILTNVVDRENDELAEMDFSSAISINLDILMKEQIFPRLDFLFEKVFQHAEEYEGDDPTWGFSDRMASAVAGRALKNLFVSLLPQAMQIDATHAFYFVVRDIGLNPARSRRGRGKG